MGGAERLFYFSVFMNNPLAENRFFSMKKIKFRINVFIKILYKSLIINSL